MLADQVNKYIDRQKLPKEEMYKVHRHVGNMIQRRMYYQLVITVPWNVIPIYHDHTDRFEEVVEHLVSVTLDCINQHIAEIASLPSSIFIFDAMKDNVIGIHNFAKDEQTIYNIFQTFLNDGYKYDIQQHEVNFSYVDQHYR